MPSDASIYEIRPLGVVRPRGVADVAACVQYAAENKIPIHARGAGTGLGRRFVGAGAWCSTSRTACARVLAIDDETVRVQPGVVLAHLNRQLARHGRLIGPDPSTRTVTTMGSVLALDASRQPLLRSTARPGDHVVSLQVVLADGQVLEVGHHAVADAAGRAEPTRTGSNWSGGWPNCCGGRSG